MYINHRIWYLQLSTKFWGITFQASAEGYSPQNCTTNLTIFICKLSLEVGSHNQFFPFSFLSLVGRSNHGTGFQAIACLDKRIEHSRIAYPFNSPEKHASVSLQDNRPITRSAIVLSILYSP